MLWGLVNSLQIIVYIGLFSTQTPANAQILFELIGEIMNMDLFSVANLFKKHLEFVNEEAFNEKFNNMGLGSLNLVLNNSSQVLFLLVWPVSIVFIVALSPL